MEFDKMGYSCYKLLPFTRTLLLEQNPPKYSRILAHHATHEFNVSYAHALSGIYDIAAHSLECYGYIDSGDGIECFLVAVDGERVRPDGNMYHVTWSLDPKKYKPVDSNKLIETVDYIDPEVAFNLGALFEFVSHKK